MTLTDYNQFFQKIAEQFIEIQHTPTVRRFLLIDPDDYAVPNFNKLDLANWCLIAEKPTTHLSENGAGKTIETKVAAFHIIKSRGKGISSVVDAPLQDEAEKIAKEIYSGIKEITRYHPKTILTAINREKGAELDYLKGMFDNCVGISCTMQFHPNFPCDFTYKSTRWLTPIENW